MNISTVFKTEGGGRRVTGHKRDWGERWHWGNDELRPCPETACYQQSGNIVARGGYGPDVTSGWQKGDMISEGLKQREMGAARKDKAGTVETGS